MKVLDILTAMWLDNSQRVLLQPTQTRVIFLVEILERKLKPTFEALSYGQKHVHSSMKDVSCSISFSFLSLDLNGISKWRKICFSIATLN